MLPAERTSWAPRPGYSSMLCRMVPTGMFSKGRQLPGLMSALALLMTVSPTFSPSGQMM